MSNSPNGPGISGSKLEAEIQGWLAQGLITPEQAEAMRAQSAAKPRRSLFTGFLYGFAAFLIGGGVIAFVAANWEGIPALVKVAGGLVLMIFFQSVGYSWRTGDRPGAGNALLILGALMFGGNIGLFTQIFSAQAALASGFGIWALGCTMLAYSSGSIPVMFIAVFASSTAFVTGAFEERVLWAFSFLVGLQSLPFALRHRSSFLFFIGFNMLTIGQIAAVSLQNAAEIALISALVCGLVMVVSSVLLWQDPLRQRMARTAEILGLLWLMGTLLFLSVLAPLAGVFISSSHSLAFHHEFSPLLTGLYAVFCVITLGPILRRQEKYTRQLPLLYTAYAVTVMNIAALLSQQAMAAWAVSLISFFVLCIALVWIGLNHRDRSFYTLGTLLLGLRLLCFFFMFDIQLQAKATLLVLGGVAVLVAALQYERWATKADAAERDLA